MHSSVAGVDDPSIIERDVANFDGSYSEALLDALDEAVGISENQPSTRLYDVVDPDALDKLFKGKSNDHPRNGGELIFHVAGCEVRVTGNGNVMVVPPAQPPTPTTE